MPILEKYSGTQLKATPELTQVPAEVHQKAPAWSVSLLQEC